MFLFNNDNKPILDAIVTIGKNVTVSLEKLPKAEGRNIIDSSDIIKNKALASTILTEYYKRMQKELSKHSEDIPTIIRPKLNSILASIDYNRHTELLKNTGYPLLDQVTIEAISKKLLLSITKYLYTTMPNVKRYAYKVDSFLKSSEKEITPNDYFQLEVIKISSLVNVLVDKDLAANLLETNYYGPITNINYITNNEISDMELNLLLQDEWDELIKDPAFIEYVNLFNSIKHTDDINNVLNNLNLRGLNALAVAVIQLSNLNKAGNLDNGGKTLLHRMVKVFIQLYNKYKAAITSKYLILGYTNHNDNTTTITVLDKIYNEYMQENGTLKAIIGSVLSSKEDDTVEAYMHNIISLNYILKNKDKFEAKTKSFIDTLILTNKNSLQNRLISYWPLALSQVLSEDEVLKYSKQVEDYVKTLPLTELANTKDTALAIFRNILIQDTNFNEFVTGYNEVELFIKKPEPEIAITYAAYRLVLLYLASQTTLVK